MPVFKPRDLNRYLAIDLAVAEHDFKYIITQPCGGTSISLCPCSRNPTAARKYHVTKKKIPYIVWKINNSSRRYNNSSGRIIILSGRYIIPSDEILLRPDDIVIRPDEVLNKF